MDIMDAIRERRTIRKFRQERIDPKILKELVDGARLAPSAANLQPLRYLIVDQPALLHKVFENLSWAGYLKPKGDPKEGEKPTAYILVLVSGAKGPYTNHDIGGAAQNIMLGAWGYGIGSCLIASVRRKRLVEAFNIPGEMELDSVIALGYKAEESRPEDEKGTIKYYKDEKQVLHVPKRKLEDVTFWNSID